MKVTFDEEGYLEFLSTNGDLPNSIELPDDDTLNYKYLNCYMLNDEGNGLVLDAEKVQMVEQSLVATSKVAELKKRLNLTDYKILRESRESSLGVKSSISEKEYLLLEAERESLVRQIREIEDGKSLVTDVSSILAEGEKIRKEKKDEIKDTKTAVYETIPAINKKIEEIEKKLSEIMILPEQQNIKINEILNSNQDSENSLIDDSENKDSSGEETSEKEELPVEDDVTIEDVVPVEDESIEEKK